MTDKERRQRDILAIVIKHPGLTVREIHEKLLRLGHSCAENRVDKDLSSMKDSHPLTPVIGRNRRYLWHHNEPPKRNLRRVYPPHRSSGDDEINLKTLEEVPPRHMDAITEAARRMLMYRSTPLGEWRPGGPTSACDWPIRQLFVEKRDDRKETRYSAAALWLSWQMAEEVET
jgi:hypothetical protein